MTGATRSACPVTDTTAMKSMKAFVGRGALAGLVGGALGAVFLWLVTEKQIRAAIALEPVTAGHDEMFSRSTQVVGGMFATVLYGLFIGVIFGVVCALLWSKLPGGNGFSRAIRLACLGFVGWVLVPALKYPANPPAVGDPNTVNDRTVAFIVLLAVSLILMVIAWKAWTVLTERGVHGAARFAAVVGGYGVVVGAILALLPASPDSVTAPATLVWLFRIESLGGQLLLWIAVGTAFGWLAERAEAAERTRPTGSAGPLVSP